MLNQPEANETVSILAIDIGSVHTHALLFGEVDGQYHFISEGIAPTTTFSPISNINEGLFQSIQQLQVNTGTILLDEDFHLIIPSQPDGAGIDRLVVTFSAGPEIKVVTIGLLKEFSLRAANDLASSTTAHIVEQISSNDQRTIEKQMSAIVQSSPDLFIFAGGTEEGASQSIKKLIALIGDVYKVLPPQCNPQVIYAGNRTLVEKVEKVLGAVAEVHLAPNLRPTLSTHQFQPAREVLAKAATSIQSNHLVGLKDLETIASSPILPSSHRFGQIIQFLGKLYEPVKGVLGVNLGASWTTFSASNGNQTIVKVLPYGLGQGLDDFLQRYPLEDIHRWLRINLSLDDLGDYLHQKILFPGSLPLSSAALEIEQAAAREILRRSSREMLESWEVEFTAFEPILAGGSLFSSTLPPAQNLLTLLDGLQPIGITTIILDTHNLIASLGAAASLSSYLPVQVLESSAFTNLGAVISPVAFEKPGTPILRVIVEYEDGNTTRTDIKQGSIVALPVSNGQSVNIHFEPLRQVLIDPFKNVRGFRVLGGVCGVVVDARGRPLEIPKDESQRKELLGKWSGFMVG
jgi:hypothetical protein